MNNKIKNNDTKFIWAILTLVMVVIALFFGLKPKGWSNKVRWLPNKSAIHFQKTGIAYINDLGGVFSARRLSDFTIELAVTPGSDRDKGSGAILVMNDGNDQRQLVVWQYGTSLIVMNGDDFDYSQKQPRIVAKNAFTSQKVRYFTIIADEESTRLFVDGRLETANSHWKLSIPDEGNHLRLVLGNSVYGNTSWSGDLHGLAISGKALSSEMISFRFNQWNADHNFDFIKQDSPLLLFTFNQKRGAHFIDQSNNRLKLEIPPKIVSLKKKFLSPPRRHLNWTSAVMGDMLVNTIGFMPLGAVLYGLLQSSSGLFRSHKKLIAVTLCMMLSLGIEIGQAWIPTRDSSMMDFVLNTIGAMLGVELWCLLRNIDNQFLKSKIPI